jgi:hypothetical protein
MKLQTPDLKRILRLVAASPSVWQPICTCQANEPRQKREREMQRENVDPKRVARVGGT